MRNQLQHDWTRETTPRLTARHPESTTSVRLLGIYACCLVPLLVITVRLAQLQLQLQPDYVEPFGVLRTLEEELPARDGRILAADGSVLADDLPCYDVLMHYRWLEQPVDRQWLRRKAWERLSRAERRQSATVAAKEQQILAERERHWKELCELSGRPVSEFTNTTREIQIRVERIWQSVEARRQKVLASEEPAPAPPTPQSSHWSGELLNRCWQQVVAELTVPPERHRHEPLVVEEQEDYHVIWQNVSAEMATMIAAHPERFPGVKTRMRTRRVYPHNDLAAHLLGARTSGPADTSPPDAPMAGPLRHGRTGLERFYDTHLRGTPGRVQLSINRHGEVTETRVKTPAQHGRDLVLTLDLSLQQRAEQLLDQALEKSVQSGDDASPQKLLQESLPPGGCLVALDVHTGAILAAATAPRFDANLLVTPQPEAWTELANDPRKPFYPRLTHMALPPGSVFKAVTAAALLESGTFHAETTIPCVGYLDRPEQHRCLIFRHHGIGHGETDLSLALCQSCNVYFFNGARKAGPAALVEWSQKFGIGRRTGIDLPSETGGTLPLLGTQGTGNARRLYTGDTLGLAIGQSSLTTTPLQIARMMAAIANGGLLVTPHLGTTGGPVSVDATPVETARPVFAHPEPQPIAGLSGTTLAAIREGLYRVVNDPAGTGYKTVRLAEVTIAGKTGTAEAGSGQSDHAWFAGYAPADQPRVAFAVVIEHGGSGSKSAGPLAREFVRSLLELGLIDTPSSLADVQSVDPQFAP